MPPSARLATATTVRLAVGALTLAAPIAGCASDAAPTGSAAPGSSADSSPVAGEQRFPDVVAASAARDETGATWSFTVTMSSPYDSPDRYADGWRVVGPDGEVYGEHTLAHDHAGEQPFTRRQIGVVIPTGVTTVTVEGHDQRYGYGGATVAVDLDGA